jgi:hypothetical protein
MIEASSLAARHAKGPPNTFRIGWLYPGMDATDAHHLRAPPTQF